MRTIPLVAAVLACGGGGDDRRSPPAPVASGAPRVEAVAPPAPDAKPLETPHYKIGFPAPSKVSETSVQTVQGPMPQRVEIAEFDGAKYLVVSGSTPPGLSAGNGSGGVDRMLSMFGAKPTRDVPVRVGDVTGREVRFSGSANGILRTFFVGSWGIQAAVVSRDRPVDEKQALRFLDSLEIIR